MQKSLILKVSLKLLTFTLIFAQAKATNLFDDFLHHVEEQFDQASSSNNKYTIVSRPLNIEHLKKAKSFEDIDEQQLTEGVSTDPLKLKEGFFNFDKTTAISLAISLGKARLVEKFFTVIPNVNDFALTAWGFRQPYTLAHMALDPQFPKAFYPVSLEDRLVIVDALGKKGANFNAIVPHNYIGVYKNPPLQRDYHQDVN